MKKAKMTAAAALAVIAVLLVYRFYIIPNVLYPVKYSEYVDICSEEYGLEKTTVYAVIKAESGFKPDNRSHTGAAGLMQIMPETGEWAAQQMGMEGYDSDSLYDPETNIRIGCWYLRYLLNVYENNLPTALAAYNAGMGNVSGWLDDPSYSSDEKSLGEIPYNETEEYIEKTLKYMECYEKYHKEL